VATTTDITTLPEQFQGALTRLELGEKRRRVEAAHKEIRELLENDDQLCSWGVDTVLIGSYKRQTAIYPGKDVDVFTKLTELDTSASPRLVYDTVLAVLKAHYGDRAEPQHRSIKVKFSVDDTDDFHVDVVPAVRKGERWAIPRRNVELWDAHDINERWVETDPEKLTELTVAMNAILNVDGRGAYVPIAKLVRQTRWHHREKQKPGGFYFELMTYWAFDTGMEGDSFAEIFAKTLRSIAVQLNSGVPLIDPALGTPYKPAPTVEDRNAAASLFSDLASRAEQALALPRCPAAAIWRSILGVNDRGPVFPIPPGCDASGNEIKDVTRVVSVGSREASGFA
jgi:hypothetical protein